MLFVISLVHFQVHKLRLQRLQKSFSKRKIHCCMLKAAAAGKLSCKNLMASDSLSWALIARW